MDKQYDNPARGVEMKKLKLKQWSWDNGFQTWVKRIHLLDDKELEKTNDWTVGFYHCEHCGAIQGFAFQLPKNIPSEGIKEAQNSWYDFLLKHAHGDGRVIMLEKRI